MLAMTQAVSWPSVSVIMPCYNAGPFLAESLRSIVDQNYPGHLEILVVDDGSTDDSVQIAASFDGVRLLRQQNGGPAAARNHALSHANGDVLAFLDADDVWTPGSLQCRVERLVAQADVGIVFGDFSYWTPTPGALPEDLPSQLPDSVLDAIRTGWVYPEILLDPIVHIIATVVRRSVIEAIGVFDTNLRTGEDYDFFIRAARHCRFSHVEKVVSRYRLHASSITRVPQPRSNEYSVVSKALANYGTGGADGRQLDASLLAMRLHKMSFDHALQHLRHGDPRIAASSFRAAIRHYPWRLKPLLLAAVAELKSLREPSASAPVRKS